MAKQLAREVINFLSICNSQRLLLRRKPMTNLNKILKNRDITLLTKVCIVKAVLLSVVMYGCENRTIEKAECWRLEAFELWCWRRVLRVPWAARRSNESILKEINPECLLEGLMLKLKLEFFGHPMKGPTHWKRPWCWERLRAGGEGDDRGWDGWMASMGMSLSKTPGVKWKTGKPGMLQSMGSFRHNLVTEQHHRQSPERRFFNNMGKYMQTKEREWE